MSLKVRAEVRFLSNISVGGETKETVFTLGEMLEPSREPFSLEEPASHFPASSDM